MSKRYNKIPGILSGKYKVETRSGLHAEYYKRAWNGTSWIYWFKIFWTPELNTSVAYFADGNELVGSEFLKLSCTDSGQRKGLIKQTILVTFQDTRIVLKEKLKYYAYKFLYRVR